LARLYVDEDVPRSVSVRLRELGHDVLTVREARKDGRGIPDDEVLSHAHSLGRAVVSKNRRHFIQLHRKSTDHSGIIVFTEDLDYAAVAERIHASITTEADLAGKLIRVNRPQS
jgi:hypothetical protein